MKIGLIWFDPFSGNQGVSALTYSFITLLEEIFQKRGTLREYIIVGNSQNYGISTLDINGKKVNIRIIRFFQLNTIKGLLRSIIYFKDYLAYKNIDLAFDISEGDSFSDIYGVERFKRINYLKEYFIKQRKILVLLPQTIGPFYNSEIKAKAISTINKSTAVFARDAVGYKFLIEETSQKYIYNNIDLAFFLPSEPYLLQEDKTKIGLNVSALLWYGGYNRKNQFDLLDSYRKLIISIIELFISRSDTQIYLIPHVIPQQHDNIIENDYYVSKEIVELYHNECITLSPLFNNPISTKNYIGGMDFFIGSRMHATIAAFSNGVPVFPLSYSIKFIGLYKETLGYDQVGDLTSELNNQLMERITNAFDNRNELKNRINSKLSNILYRSNQDLKKILAKLIFNNLID